MKIKRTTTIEHAATGLHIPESLARQIDVLAKDLPKDFTFRRIVKASEEFALDAGSRTDISWVTTDAVDRQNEVVLPKGMDQSQYDGVVTFAHKYDELPVGRCLWIKPKADMGKNGVLAKTQYHSRPKGHDGDWLPDAIISIQQEGGCKGKSIGFLPTSMRAATKQEIEARPELKNASVIIDGWKILEYAVAPVPCNAEAITVSVSKSLTDPRLRELIVLTSKSMAEPTEPAPAIIEPKPQPKPITPFVTAETIRKALLAEAEAFKAALPGMTQEIFSESLDRARGRV